jgi:hypothetical protein
MDSNHRFRVNGELMKFACLPTDRRSFASFGGVPWGGYHMDKAGLELKVSFGEFEHLAPRGRESLTGVEFSLIARFNSVLAGKNSLLC